jgi:uncharacterized protein (TIGR03084 family)
VPADLVVLCRDAADEHRSVSDLLAGAPEATWARPTPAAGWTVRDQISHLTYFDRAARLAISDPAAFLDLREEAMCDVDGFVDRALEYGRDLDGARLLAHWGEERAALLEAALQAPPGLRVPWFGPDMAVASSITARIMETWAHGQDVADCLGVTLAPTARIRHVCDLGVRARGFAFAVRGQPAPETPVRVELTAPDGSTWAWGPEDSDRVSGDALDFALVVTQRRHLDDTGLVVDGDGARRWMAIAQAFAGPPGAGRPRTGH